MDVDEHDLDYLAQAHWHHFRYRFGEMIGLDRANKRVRLAATHDDEGGRSRPSAPFAYDTLVIAVGSRSNDFGTPGAKEHAIALETPDEAARFNRRLVNACLRAHTQAEPVRPGQLHVAIIGAGATGTELSAELHRTARSVVAYGLDRIDPDKDIKITLIEAADRILPGLPPAPLRDDLAPAAGPRHRRAGERARHRGQRRRRAAGERRLHPLRARGLGRRRARAGRARRARRARGQPEQPARGAPHPADDPRRRHLRHRRLRLLPAGRGEPTRPAARPGRPPDGDATCSGRSGGACEAEPLQPYVYRDFGSLVSLGEYSTVGNMMGFLAGKSLFIEGYFARLMYRSLYKMHETALHGWFRVSLGTLARLLTRRTEPHVKLH